MRIHIYSLLISALSLLSSGTCTGSAFDELLAEQPQLLQSHDLGTETEDLIDFLRQLQPDPKQQIEIAALVQKLSSSDFRGRELAMERLANFGPAAKAKLIDASQCSDAEIAWRSAKLLKQLDAGDLPSRQSLILAALQILKDRRAAAAVPVLLQTLPILDEANLQDSACEAIWASTDRTHAELIRAAIKEKQPSVQVAAFVALEISTGEDATETIVPYLQSDSPILRLAAARALAERRPRESIAVLIELVGDQSGDVAWQADSLLQLYARKPMELSGQQSLPEFWREWSDKELPDINLKLTLGPKRLDLSGGRNLLQETFARQIDSLEAGYGRFFYESDNAGGASVVDGKLLISGENDEGDQRLYLTSQRMIGRNAWPNRLEVQAKLGGKSGNNFGWHVGVSVGRVKVLFHPSLNGGGFRVETTETHQYLISNENMGFTPAADSIHDMLIKVTKSDDGAEFDITIRDADSEAEFHRKMSVTSEQLGAFNRIGLERSGRRGADAVFDSVVIKLGP